MAADRGASSLESGATSARPDEMLGDAIAWCVGCVLRLGTIALLYAAYVVPTIAVLGIFHPTAPLGWRFLCAAALGVFNVAYVYGVVGLRDRLSRATPRA